MNSQTLKHGVATVFVKGPSVPSTPSCKLAIYRQSTVLHNGLRVQYTEAKPGLAVLAMILALIHTVHLSSLSTPFPPLNSQHFERQAFSQHPEPHTSTHQPPAPVYRAMYIIPAMCLLWVHARLCLSLHVTRQMCRGCSWCRRICSAQLCSMARAPRPR